MDPIEAAITKIESREPGETFSYRKVAEEFNIVPSTLIRRHKGITQPREIANCNQQNLS